MEILFVSHKHPPSTGGMEKQSFELVTGMQPYAKIHTIIQQPGETKLAFFASLNRRIVNLCRMHPGISVIHYNDGLVAALCLKHRGYEHLKRTATVHGLDVVFPNLYFQKRILPAFNKLNRIFAVSNATARACVQRGINAHKIEVIHNGVDWSIALEQPRRNALTYLENRYNIKLYNRRILVCMGRAVKRKGFSWFIKDVLPKLPPDVILLIIGPYNNKAGFNDRLIRSLPPALGQQLTLFLGHPGDEHTLRQQLCQLSAAENARHLGRVPFSDVLQLLMLADAFVMPNIAVEGDMEGFGLVCLEACLCGTKVFASAIEGITDVIKDGQNGYLLPSGDADAWAAALTKMLYANPNDNLPPEQIKAYTMQHFGWDKMVKEYLQSFEALTQAIHNITSCE